MWSTLDRWRAGKLGTVIFYGYMLAVVVLMTLATIEYFKITNDRTELQQANTKIQAQQQKLELGLNRSCEAITGAIQFWRGVRASTEDLLNDQTLSPGERNSNEQYLAALNKVISKGSKLTC